MAAFEPRDLAEALATRLIARADQLYVTRDWSGALVIYQLVIERHPAVADAFALALSAGHCEIELADAVALEGWTAVYGPATGLPREITFANDMRVRALECCREKDFRRATVLLRYIAQADESTGFTYADGMLTRRSSCDAFLRTPDIEPPRFLADNAIESLAVDEVIARHQGTRILVVRRYGHSKQQYDVFDTMRRTATQLGLTVQEVNSMALPGPESDAYVATLDRTIEAFRPQVIIWDELFLSGISAQPEHRDDVAQLLETVRRRFGTRVVKFYTDAWYITAHMPDQLFAQLGRCYDLINHYHPAILDRGTDAEKAAVFCFLPPWSNPPPTVAAGTIARACFLGSIHPGGTPRIVWWAECARLGLDLDFVETVHDTTHQLSDLDYFNRLRSYQVSVNFTLRPTGARIFTGRVFDVVRAGSVLLEENSFDTRYFLMPGVHYAAFETLPDLAALIPALLADLPRRLHMSAAARTWVARYFDGDHYWAGLLTRLFP